MGGGGSPVRLRGLWTPFFCCLLEAQPFPGLNECWPESVESPYLDGQKERNTPSRPQEATGTHRRTGRGGCVLVGVTTTPVPACFSQIGHRCHLERATPPPTSGSRGRKMTTNIHKRQENDPFGITNIRYGKHGRAVSESPCDDGGARFQVLESWARPRL